MTDTCKICNKKIGLMDMEYATQGLIIHDHCLPTFEADPEKYGGKVSNETRKTDKKNEGNKKTKFVLTDIDLPFGRVFWVTVQFFVAGLILAIPIWIILMVIIYN